MPQTANQEVRILYARLEPGDRTPRHRHRFPVTVFVDHGVFTLHLDGQEPVRISAGEAFVEPAGVAMTGYNHDTHAPATMMLFYVCTPNAPFAEALA